MNKERAGRLRRFVAGHVIVNATELIERCAPNSQADFGTRGDGKEVLEHWIVDPWLAAKLSARGEAVQPFCGLWIWGRTTSGQAIHMDEVVRELFDAEGLDKT